MYVCKFLLKIWCALNKKKIFLLYKYYKHIHRLFKLYCIYYLHTYIIGHNSLSIRITIYLLTQLMLYVLNFYMSIGIYSLKSTPNDRLLRSFFMKILFALRIFARNLLKGSRRRNNFSYFHFVVWPGIWTRTLRLINQHTTYQTTATLMHTYLLKIVWLV